MDDLIVYCDELFVAFLDCNLFQDASDFVVFMFSHGIISEDEMANYVSSILSAIGV